MTADIPSHPGRVATTSGVMLASYAASPRMISCGSAATRSSSWIAVVTASPVIGSPPAAVTSAARKESAPAV
jgi:hypothetical protein